MIVCKYPLSNFKALLSHVVDHGSQLTPLPTFQTPNAWSYDLFIRLLKVPNIHAKGIFFVLHSSWGLVLITDLTS